MDIDFKNAAMSDLETLMAFMRELYESDQIPFDDDARAALEKLLSDDSLGRVWLICSEGEAVGYLVLTLGYSLEFRGRDAFIDELYIRESHRGRGLGKRAIKFIEEACRALGVQALHLEVQRANTAAQAFYRRAGFEDHDRYLMTRWIPRDEPEGEG
jgi:ribosomal protein S18 acetylase RimI-like enzyme